MRKAKTMSDQNPPIPENSEFFRMTGGRPFVKLPEPGGKAPAFWGWTAIRHVVNRAPEYRPWIAAMAVEAHNVKIDVLHDAVPPCSGDCIEEWRGAWAKYTAEIAKREAWRDWGAE